MTKVCFKCSRELPRSEFYAHPQMGDGLLGRCKDCTRADVSKNYRENIERYREYERQRFANSDRKRSVIEAQKRSRERNKDKWRARAAVTRAIRSGKIERGPCAVCGATENVQAHHPDYSKPLTVDWLCFRHHREAHGQQVA